MANLNLELTDTEAAADLNPLSQNANSGPQYVVVRVVMGTGLKPDVSIHWFTSKFPQRKCMCSTTSVV